MHNFEDIIIGAGPGGLQMGYFLHRAGRRYVILEANDCAGSFYAEYPRHRTLLSINKRFNAYPEADFNLRHDWNSLLSDEESLLFKHYSEELYPDADDLHRYLKDFAAHFELNVKYDTRLAAVRSSEGSGFVLTDAAGEVYACDRLLMATGVVAPRIPTEIEGIDLAEGYEDHSLDCSLYENKRVAIIGRGNSAFEVANHLAGHASIVHLLVGQPIKHAWQTHYPGDLRAINNTVLDMYQLKSLHAAVGFRPRKLEKLDDGTFKVTMEEDYPHWEVPGTGTTTMYYDHVIRCTGWNYVDRALFAEDCMPAMDEKMKLPQLSSAWETSIEDLYYIGGAMQARDKSSASAFIHGFRYNVRTLFHLMEERYHSVPLPARDFPYRDADDLEAIADYLIRRVSTTSALFQLFGFLCDAVVIAGGKARLFYELPVAHVLERDDFAGAEHLVLVTLEYGFHKYPKGAATLDFIHPADASKPSCSAYLHPVLRCYSRGELVEEVHLGESLVVRYDIYDYDENYDAAHKNTIKNCLNRQERVTDEEFSQRVYTPEGEQTVFEPWPEEKVRELEERRIPGDAECPFVV